MTGLSKSINLDKWYGITLYLSILCCTAPFIKDVKFINEGHLFLFGIGLGFISISNFMANRHLHQFGYNQLVQWQQIIHSPKTIIIQVIGITLAIIALVAMVKDLM